MRKIDVSDYEVGGSGSYPVKGTLIQLLFNPELKLSARDLIPQDAIARKIESANGTLLLEESEYQKVKAAIETVKGYGRADLEFVNRILNAPEVPVKEA
ncbi:MAG: hypothetical protein M0Q91_09960 [Methanoregula sp.]|jgi:hypothetical protein|nr:hypothetical protein [Methanoregula sp.]